MGKTKIIYENAEWFQADGSFADLLMAIEFRSAGGFGVVAVPDFDAT